MRPTTHCFNKKWKKYFINLVNQHKVKGKQTFNGKPKDCNNQQKPPYIFETVAEKFNMIIST